MSNEAVEEAVEEGDDTGNSDALVTEVSSSPDCRVLEHTLWLT